MKNAEGQETAATGAHKASILHFVFFPLHSRVAPPEQEAMPAAQFRRALCHLGHEFMLAVITVAAKLMAR